MYRPPVSSVKPLLDSESTIRGLTQDFCTAFNTGNYDQAAALFASDGTLTLSHRESSQGAKAIERMLRQYGDSGYQNLRFESTRLVNSGDMAVEIGRYSVSSQSGTTTATEKGEFLRAWHRLGVWRIIADSWNNTSPAVDQEIGFGGGTKVA
jgi:uncharacterized protein (TIGR02246 family)